ncbi:MAG TPA: NADH-quinone oxidoreductase subunit NuoK [Polyangiaceae bacterium]|nr:NADH-quinone oxidoreductase subunit NuoK [Polyangiaceae bacterium]
MIITLAHFLVVGAVLFGLGLFTVLTRRNAVAVLMGVELILNAGMLNLVAFGRLGSGDVGGQVFALFGIVLAAAEAVVALAIVLQLYRAVRSVDTTDATELRE